MSTRLYIGISSRGPTALRNVRLDETGEPLILLDQDEIAKLTVDFSDWLEGAETIASATATARGCTIDDSTPSIVSDNSFVVQISSVTGADGDITVVATSSTGEKWRGIIRVRRTSRYMDEALLLSDYA